MSTTIPLAFVLALGLPAAYLAWLALEWLSRWYTRAGPPRERVLAIALTLSAVGLIVGQIAQPHWDSLRGCLTQAEWVACFFPVSAR